MTIIWVSPFGNDMTGDGSEDNPYLTIEYALTLFVSGDQIRLKDGTYVTVDSIVITGKDGSIFADNPQEVTIRPAQTTLSAAAIDISSATRFAIDGIVVEQATDPTGNYYGIYAYDVADLVVDNCTVENFTCTANDAAGIYTDMCFGIVRNCTISGFTTSGLNIYGINAGSMDVVNCVISDVSAPAGDACGVCVIKISPRVLSAVCVDLTHTQITFNAAMLPDAALTTASNYVYSDPTIVVSGVVIDSPTQVTVATNAQTGSTTYTVTVSNVQSTYYAVIDPSYDDATYTTGSAYLYDVTTHYHFNLDTLDSSLNSYNGTMECTNVPWNIEPITAPSSRCYQGVAYDSARNVMVVFGGYDLTNNLGDTWEFDGVTWTKKFPTTKPSARRQTLMTYDSVNNVCLLFGGYDGSLYNELWSWDGTNWTKLVVDADPASPPDRYGCGFSYDTSRGVAVLFGGANIGGTALSDTWEWSSANQTWSMIKADGAVGNPSQRKWLSQVYDSNKNRTLVFGGATTGWTNNNECWEWNGAVWANVTAVGTKPSARRVVGMAYDPVANRTLIYGGTDAATALDETWEWDGAARTWASKTPAHKPSKRQHAYMVYFAIKDFIMFIYGTDAGVATIYPEMPKWNRTDWQTVCQPTKRSSVASTYDSVNNVVVMFGGYDGTANLDETWLWNGVYWENVSPASSPTARRVTNLSFDNDRSKVVLFGGYSSANLQDTWEWDTVARTWTPKAPASKPLIRRGVQMAYDKTRRLTVLFGGLGAAFYNDLWTWNGTNWTQVIADSAGTPLRRASGTLTWDVGRDALLLFGGAGAASYNDTWEWNGGAWASVSPAAPSRPTIRYAHGMSYDTANNCMIMFGGVDGVAYNTETWQWVGGNPGTWNRIYPTSSPLGGAINTMVYDPIHKNFVFCGSTNGAVYYNDTNVFGFYPSAKLLEGCGFDGTGSTGANAIGTRQAILLPAAVDTAILAAGVFTIAAWVRPHEFVVDHMNMFAAKYKQAVSPTGTLYFGTKAATTGLLKAGVVFTGGITTLESTAALTVNNLHFCVMTLDTDKKIRIYIDGALDSTSAAASGTLTNTEVGTRMLIGCSQFTNLTTRGNYMDGVLDDVGIWTKALSAADVLTLFNGGQGVAW